MKFLAPQSEILTASWPHYSQVKMEDLTQTEHLLRLSVKLNFVFPSCLTRIEWCLYGGVCARLARSWSFSWRKRAVYVERLLLLFCLLASIGISALLVLHHLVVLIVNKRKAYGLSGVLLLRSQAGLPSSICFRILCLLYKYCSGFYFKLYLIVKIGGSICYILPQNWKVCI